MIMEKIISHLFLLCVILNIHDVNKEVDPYE